METASPSYTLNKTQREQALDILQREKKDIMDVMPQERKKAREKQNIFTMFNLALQRKKAREKQNIFTMFNLALQELPWKPGIGTKTILALAGLVMLVISWRIRWLIKPILALLSAFAASSLNRARKERLKTVDHLKEILNEVKPSAGDSVAISSEAYEMIAEVEHDQIDRGRTKSILESLENPDDTTYFVQMNPRAHEAMKRLDLAERLRVQDHIDALTMAPPSSASASETQGVPKTLVEITFSTDKKKQLITILSLEPAADGASSSSDGGA